MKRIRHLSTLAACASLGIGSARAYVLPIAENIQTVAGFYVPYGKTAPVLVPTQIDGGSLSVSSAWNTLAINPIGSFTYARLSAYYIGQPIYSYTGPTFNHTYVSYGFWQQQADVFGLPSNAPTVWGAFAAGSKQDFSMPGSGGATYCGEYNAHDSYGSGVGGFSGTIKIQVSWNTRQITTFSASGLGATTGASSINSSGNAKVLFSAVAANGTLAGGTETALLGFYGPGAIQVVGTFSGPWKGLTAAGAFYAQLVPPGIGGC